MRGRADGRCRQLGARALGAGARGCAAAGAAAGETSGCAGVQGRAGCVPTRQPCAATLPGGSATTRPRAHGLCAQAGPAGPVLVLVHLAWFSTWFLTRYFS